MACDEVRAILRAGYRDLDRLADTPAAIHVVVTHGERYCYAVVRRERRKGLAVFASLLYVSDPEVLQRRWRTFARHLLVRHGIVATLAELRMVGRRPWPSRMVGTPRQKMFRTRRCAPVKSTISTANWLRSPGDVTVRTRSAARARRAARCRNRQSGSNDGRRASPTA